MASDETGHGDPEIPTARLRHLGIHAYFRIQRILIIEIQFQYHRFDYAK
jgi:hypothetical protein